MATHLFSVRNIRGDDELHLHPQHGRSGQQWGSDGSAIVVDRVDHLSLEEDPAQDEGPAQLPADSGGSQRGSHFGYFLYTQCRLGSPCGRLASG